MFRRSSLIAMLLVALAATASAQTLHVAPLPRDGQLLVSFKLGQALTDEIREAIHSGLTVSFVYKVDLRRSSPIWFDRTIGSAVVTATVRFDNLTRKYNVTRAFDGRMERAEVTDKEDVAWEWLTSSFERLPLFRSSLLEPNGEYYVRVRAHSTPRNAAFLWPWQGDDVVGLAKFTFIR